MQKIAGMLFFLAGSIILMGITTAEIFYPPGYSISFSMISTLGASPPPDSIIRQPSAEIFDKSIIIAGILIMIGAYFLQKGAGQKMMTIPTILFGLGAFGVGIFPAFHAIIHPIVALITFLFGGIAATYSSKVTSSPFKILAPIFGLTSLLFLFLGVVFPHLIVPVLGRGGTERWVAYPLVLWLVGFGGYLMHSSKKSI